jgi:hypothetical protein
VLGTRLFGQMAKGKKIVSLHLEGILIFFAQNQLALRRNQKKLSSKAC